MFRKKAFGGCKSKKFVFGYKNAGRRDCSVWRLGDVACGTEMILIG